MLAKQTGLTRNQVKSKLSACFVNLLAALACPFVAEIFDRR
jgi:hypothetical protein